MVFQNTKLTKLLERNIKMTHIEVLKLTILGRPISKDNQPRGISKYGKYFTRPEYRKYERSVKDQAFVLMAGRQPFEGRLFVCFVFFFKNKVRPDLLNAPKSFCDALNGIVWYDDRQIELATLQVCYDKQNPRVDIVVNKLV